MKTLSSTLFAVSSLAALAQAVPDVTPVLVENGCASYPQYGPGTGFVARFIINVNQCTDPETSEPCPVDGHGASLRAQIVDGEEDKSQGFLTIAHLKDMAQIRFQCDGAKGFVESQTLNPVADYTYDKINVADNPLSANLMWGLPEDATIPIEPYRHHIDGEEQEGTFLGSQNVTTWGIKKYEREGAGYPHWLFRLLVPGSEDPETGEALKEGEYEAFIKVDHY